MFKKTHKTFEISTKTPSIFTLDLDFSHFFSLLFDDRFSFYICPCKFPRYFQFFVFIARLSIVARMRSLPVLLFASGENRFFLCILIEIKHANDGQRGKNIIYYLHNKLGNQKSLLKFYIMRAL